MNLRWFQKGFNYSQDGPGNRLVYHLQGCNLRCPWCSNPEGLDPSADANTDSVEDIAQSIISAIPMFFDHGGLTLTGGEVTLQADAALELIKTVKAYDVHVAIETNGISKRLSAMFPWIDLLMLDIKHYDNYRHNHVTGGSNKLAIENLGFALEAGISTLVRIPVIHGFNDQQEDIEGFVGLFNKFSRINVELLPYHDYGKIKWKKLGLEYTINDGRPSKQFLQDFTNALTDAGINVVST